LGDALENAVRVAQDVVVPEAEDAIALRFDEAGARFVISYGFGMLAAVQLDDEPLREASEVGEVWADRHLPPPFVLRQLCAQRAPQALLGLRGVAA
jgi:hypothetical protein